MRSERRADERAGTGDGREVMAEHDPAIGRHEVAAVVDALGGSAPHVVEREHLGGEKARVKAIADRIHSDRGDNEPGRVDALAARERDDSDGSRGDERDRGPEQSLDDAGHVRSKALAWRKTVKQAERRARGSREQAGEFRPERVRRDFPGLRGIVFLNAASMGVPSAEALAAIDAQRRWLARGPRHLHWADFVERFERGIGDAKTEAARMLRADVDEVGLIPDTTAGLHQAVDAIPFRQGDNVVLCDLEYPQVALAAENARRELGVEVRFVSHRGGRVTVDDYRPAIDRRTRAVLASSVGWVTGERLDLASFSQLAEERGFFLVVDAVQQLGALSLDCSKLAVDFLTSGGYKWLNAPFGCGVFYVRRRAHERGLRVRRVGILGLEEPSSGWGAFYDSPDMKPLPKLAPAATVRRFEAQGTPNRLGAAGLAAALRHRNRLERRAVDSHICDLGGELIEELRARGARVWTPREPRARAGIITFTFAAGVAGDERLRAFLERRGIFTTVRYCSGVGGVRAAIHLFNTRRDVAALLAAVDRFRH